MRTWHGCRLPDVLEDPTVPELPDIRATSRFFPDGVVVLAGDVERERKVLAEERRELQELEGLYEEKLRLEGRVREEYRVRYEGALEECQVLRRELEKAVEGSKLIFSLIF